MTSIEIILAIFLRAKCIEIPDANAICLTELVFSAQADSVQSCANTALRIARELGLDYDVRCIAQESEPRTRKNVNYGI